MAGRMFRLPFALATRHLRPVAPSKHNAMVMLRRNKCYTDSGALLPEPAVVRFGFMRALGVVVPFVLLGAYISMELATLLEEHDLFVPDDDDDD